MKKLTRRELLKRAAAMGGGVLLADNLVALALAQSEGEALTIRYLTPLWASTTDRRPERQIAFTRVIESFNDAYADQGIQVEEVVGDGNPITITQEMDAGTVDAAWINYGTYPNHLLAGQLVDLEPFLTGEADEFFPWTIEALRSVNGTLAALWHNTDTPLLYYNTEKIATPPQTWSDVVTMAEAVKAEELNAFAITYPFVGWIQMNSGMYEALGGTWVDEEGAPVLFDGANRDIWAQMFAFYIDLLERGLIPPSAVANDQIQQMPDVYAGNVYSFAGNSNFHLRQLQPNLPPEEYEKMGGGPLALSRRGGLRQISSRGLAHRPRGDRQPRARSRRRGLDAPRHGFSGAARHLQGGRLDTDAARGLARGSLLRRGPLRSRYFRSPRERSSDADGADSHGDGRRHPNRRHRGRQRSGHGRRGAGRGQRRG